MTLAIREESVRLPDTFWCYDPLTDQPPVNDLPALTNGFITFGCLNNFPKVNDGCLVLWAKVLQCGAPVAFVAAGAQGPGTGHVLAILEGKGDRCVTCGVCRPGNPRHEYLELYHRIDLGLDPFPSMGTPPAWTPSGWAFPPSRWSARRWSAGRAGASCATWA